MHLAKEVVWEAFKIFDIDGSGTVTKKDARGGIRLRTQIPSSREIGTDALGTDN